MITKQTYFRPATNLAQRIARLVIENTIEPSKLRDS